MAVFYGVNAVFAGLMLAIWLLFKPRGMMYNNVTAAADEGMNDIACEIYKNAKE